MKESLPKALQTAAPDFSAPREAVRHEDNMKLEKAKACVKKLSETHDTKSIKIPNGLIITTCPEKWDDHLKALRKGNNL